MWRISALARPEVWLCLLGSFLALIAFFLPYYTPPLGSIFLPGSLWDILMLMVFQHHDMRFSTVTLSTGLLLLLLLGIVALAFLALFLRSPRWKIMTIYRRLTTITLIFHLFAALGDLFNYWVQASIAALSTDDPYKETLSLVSIGAWLIPVGLLLALVGGMLLKHREARAGG